MQNRVSITTNLSLNPDFFVSLAVVKLKRGINVVILFVIVSCFSKCCLSGTPLRCWTISFLFFPDYLLCFRNLAKRITRCSRFSFGLLYPTTRYFLCFSWITLKWTGGRWTGQLWATQLWAWVPYSCFTWRSSIRHSI